MLFWADHKAWHLRWGSEPPGGSKAWPSTAEHCHMIISPDGGTWYASCLPTGPSKQTPYLRRGLYSLKLRAVTFICPSLSKKVQTCLWERGQHNQGLAALLFFLLQAILKSDFLTVLG